MGRRPHEEVTSHFKKYVLLEKARLEAEVQEPVHLETILEDIANASGIGYRGMSSIYYNRSNPSLPVALRISKHLKVSVHDLFELIE